MATRVNLSAIPQLDLRCMRGDTFLFDGFDFWSDDAGTIPVNISADTFRMQVKNDLNEIILTLTGSSNFTVSGSGNNHLAISETATNMLVTANEVGNPYKYDIEWTKSSNGAIKTFVYGYFDIVQDVTTNA